MALPQRSCKNTAAVLPGTLRPSKTRVTLYFQFENKPPNVVSLTLMWNNSKGYHKQVQEWKRFEPADVSSHQECIPVIIYDYPTNNQQSTTASIWQHVACYASHNLGNTRNTSSMATALRFQFISHYWYLQSCWRVSFAERSTPR
jgi:hypothetical protein